MIDIFFFLCPLCFFLKFCANTDKDLSFVFKGKKSRIKDTIIDLTISLFSAKCNPGFPYSRDCGAFCRKIAK